MTSALAPRLREPSVLQAVYDSVRPYGRALTVFCAEVEADQMRAFVESEELPGARVARVEGGIRVTRTGALPGAADWTHLYGNIANTVKSDDRLVKLPLGVLWFGGNSNMDVLPRHGHGPAEQVVGGRLIVQGAHSFSARDVYTGRTLWKREMPDLDTFGIYYDETYTNTPLSTIYNQVHIPGANARGANFVAGSDAIYVAVGSECRVLSPVDGEILRRIPMTALPSQDYQPRWGFVGVVNDILLGGTGFAHYTRRVTNSRQRSNNLGVDLSASAGLAAYNRTTGELIWTAPARYGFVHNGIVAGNGRIYCLDRLPKSVEEKLERRGRPLPEDYRLVAFDALTGDVIWEHSEVVFGSWLAFDKERDILLQAGARAPDRLDDEVGRGMAAHHGASGRVIWSKLGFDYNGPCILHNGVVVTTPPSNRDSSGAIDLETGAPYLIPNPLTGTPEPWRFRRAYGCNTPIASEHLLTFRSGAAGFYDIECHSGTGNFGGFRSGCSANLVAANGVLNAPDYTRTCSCAYQNQTSLGLIHMPELEIWTYNSFDEVVNQGGRLIRMGINFGAPGDRRDPSGSMWLEFPRSSGVAKELPVSLDGAELSYFRHHSSQVAVSALPWVVASGVEGISELKLALGSDEDDRRYRVRLHFLEPRMIQRGDRIFSVKAQGEPCLEKLDVLAEAGGTWRGLTREINGVSIGSQLTLEFEAVEGSRLPPILCGVDLISERATTERLVAHDK